MHVNYGLAAVNLLLLLRVCSSNITVTITNSCFSDVRM